ncbi:MAG: DegT/DnrJ/EryC1/StrS family aminotransferase, partial [Candidatus Omnitrophica bacterium]|nr:DegT/DnrJ/EryC1/StrS family aminotransferase [Candidatus Omnitrophota bacterium]
VDVERLQKRLMRRGITTRRTFMPVPEFPPYKRYKKSGYKNAYTICKRGLCLPSSTLNSKDSIRYVCRIIKEVL